MKLQGIAIVALAVVSFVLGTSSAASATILKTYEAEAPIQLNNGDCGANLIEDEVLGTAVLERTGNKVTVDIRMKGGEPYTKYLVELYGNGFFCEDIGRVVTYETGAKGQGIASGVIAVPAGDTEFFAAPYDLRTGYYNDTPYTALP